MNTLLVSGIFISITSIILMTLLKVFGSTILHRMWFLTNLAVLGWGIGCFFIGKSTSPNEAYFWWRIAIASGVFIAPFFYHTICIFAVVKQPIRLIVSYIEASLFVILALLTTVTINRVRLLSWSVYYPTGNILFFIMIVCWATVIFLGTNVLIILLMKSTGKKNLQTRYLIVAFLVGFIGGGITLLPAFDLPHSSILPFGNFGVALYAIIGTYAILKHRIIDIKIAVTRATLFAIIYLLVLGLPFWVGYKYHLWKYSTAIMAVLATLGPFAYIYLSRKAEKKLLAEDFRRYDILKRFAATLSRMRDIGLERLLKLIVYRLIKTMGISSGAIYLNDEEENKYLQKAVYALQGEKYIPVLELPENSALVNFLLTYRKEILLEDVQRLASEKKISKNHNHNSDHSANGVNYPDILSEMHQLNAALVLPSFLDKELIGFLVLSEKLSDKPYSEADIEVLITLSRQASLAILNAISVIKLRNREREFAAASRIVEIGNLASATGHQLGNVLNNIMNAGYALKDNDTVLNPLEHNPEAKAAFIKTVDAIITNASDGDKIIEEIRNYSRPEGEAQRSLVDLKDVLNKTLDMLYIQINKFQNIDIKLRLNPDVPAVYASPVGLQNVFVNMFNNAYDSIQEMKEYLRFHPELKMEGYKGAIEVRARRIKGNVEIHIVDNGKGMAHDVVRKLFTPHFTTKASSDKRKEMRLSGGTGIGLYIIRFLVHEYGGNLDLYKTEPLKGADFLIQLPIPKNDGG